MEVGHCVEKVCEFHLDFDPADGFGSLLAIHN